MTEKMTTSPVVEDSSKSPVDPDMENGREHETVDGEENTSTTDEVVDPNDETTAHTIEYAMEPAPAVADEASAVKDEEDEQVYQQQGWCYSCLTRAGCVWLARFPDTWPRTFSLLFGVAGPVILLVCIALFFGFILAELEAPQEIDANNDVIAERAVVSYNQAFVRNVTSELPKICLALAFRNQTTEAVFEEAIEEAIALIYLNQTRPFNQTEEQNEIPTFDKDTAQSFITFMKVCGDRGLEITGRFSESNLTLGELGDLSFNWIQCYAADGSENRAFNRIMGNYIRPPKSNVTQLRPDIQEASVVHAWNADQQTLFDQFQQEMLVEGMSKKEEAAAVSQARQRAFEEADGFGGCAVNSEAGAWFWFTVMTTIGYGNTAPVTTGGRAMVYTLGFLSILIFAGVLAKAGTIVSAIFDDWVDRVKVPLLRSTWGACLWWGLCFYGWMAMVALYTDRWKENRLGEEFSLRDAFWFSFISTTTVGLGDFYLEHQVLLRRDLIFFGLMFLIGFILLANFLVKLTELLNLIIPRKHRDLEAALKNTDLCWHPTKRTEGGEKGPLTKPSDSGDDVPSEEPMSG